MIRGRCFFRHEDGSHNETWCYLARDTEKGDVFVVIQKNDSGGRWSHHRMSVDQFLAEGSSTRASNLKKLLGTLVDDDAEELQDVPPR